MRYSCVDQAQLIIKLDVYKKSTPNLPSTIAPLLMTFFAPGDELRNLSISVLTNTNFSLLFQLWKKIIYIAPTERSRKYVHPCYHNIKDLFIRIIFYPVPLHKKNSPFFWVSNLNCIFLLPPTGPSDQVSWEDLLFSFCLGGTKLWITPLLTQMQNLWHPLINTY